MNLVEEFERMVQVGIDEEGVYPHPGMFIDIDGKTNICALDLTPDQIYQWFWNQVSIENVREIIFGLDRTTKPGQGTEFDDVLTCVHWREDLDDGPDPKWHRCWRVGVINYQYQPDGNTVVRPIDWDNTFWRQQMGAEVRQFTPPFRCKIMKGQPEDASKV